MIDSSKAAKLPPVSRCKMKLKISEIREIQATNKL
jgi:hypothetical protein